ncbi:MAG: hypothetical protein IKQ17_06240 [Kiritimatiellae bacterium]|nr:hypothetical protein [Kiritimatiellia bacterium]
MNKMMKHPAFLAAAVALCVGMSAGWFAARAWGDAAVSSKPPYRYD